MSRSEDFVTEALYRRYRPDTFEDMVGQDHVTDILKRALNNGRASHAYLFSGPRGCGKTTSARILARCLNCAEGPTDIPCGKCPSCIDLAVGGPGSLDVVEIDAASNRGVDDARELREKATFAPARDRYKVFVLDEAHMVTREGFNALLKIVEEPPPHVKFIFATTEPEKVIGTIKSRTHHYHFRLVPPEVLVPYLEGICAREGIEAEKGVLDLVVRAGGGSVRDSMSVLDQLLAGSRDGVIEYGSSVALLGYTDSALLDQMIDALSLNDGSLVFEIIEKIVASGHDPRRFTDDLLQRVRDLVICALAPGQAGDIMPHHPADQLERMLKQANSVGSRALSQQADIIEAALRTMVGATSPRLQLELLAARLLARTETPALPAVQSEPRPTSTKKPPVTTVEPTPRAPESTADVAPPPTTGPTGGTEIPWEEIVARVNEISRVSGAIVRNTKAQALPGRAIALIPPPHMKTRIEAELAKVQEAVEKVMGTGWSVQIGDGGDAPKVVPAEPAPAHKLATVMEPPPESSADSIYKEQPVSFPEPISPEESEEIDGSDEYDNASLDDEDIENPTQNAEELILEIFGGRVIDREEGNLNV